MSAVMPQPQPLTFPLNGERNRPIYDFGGRLVSIPENAPLFVACANLVHELANAGSSLDVLDVALQAEKIMREQGR
jgi:hypothetical protein